MTLSYSQAKVLYAGNGQTTKWDIPFAFLNTADLQITKINANGESEVLQNDFNIDLQEHAVFYPMPGSQTPPLAQGEKLLICRHTPLTQQTDFQAQQSFDPSVLEEGYDKAMMIAQEQAEVLARAVKFPAQVSPSSTDAAAYLKNLEKTLQQAQQANEISQEVISAAGQASQTASEAVNKAEETVSQLNAYVVSAQEAANFAQKWAVQTNTEVVPGQGYGAKKYALDAAACNTQTQEGVAQAQTAAAQAAQNAQQAAAKAAAALSSQTLAQEAAETSQNARQEAQQIQGSCVSLATAAQTSAQQAQQSAQAAASSANMADIQNKITNCLTKIPQDIKLKLTDGVLTLKADSKAYRGNGQVVTIAQDITMTYADNAAILVCVDVSGTALQGCPIQYCSCGAADPQTANSIYYDTSANIVKFYPSSGGAGTEVSLPVAICTATGQISSIDQVFNGFGYIGNTLFALPGVEGLIPNGRTAEGALANTKVTVSAVRKLSFSTQAQSHFGLTATALFASASALYNAADNTNYNPSTGNTLGFCNCGTVVTDSTGQITSFMPKYAFHAVDYSGADFVINSYSDANGNWYRKYKSGWVEQGGLSANKGGIVTVSLLQDMANTNYYISANLYSTSSSTDKGYLILSNKNNTSFQFNFSNTNNVLWYACGQGA